MMANLKFEIEEAVKFKTNLLCMVTPTVFVYKVKGLTAYRIERLSISTRQTSVSAYDESNNLEHALIRFFHFIQLVQETVGKS
jgi:hypothetical protein